MVVWDETPMLSRYAVEAFDRMLWNINESDLLFDSKVIVFGRDFHQVLLVVRRGTREQQIDASLIFLQVARFN